MSRIPRRELWLLLAAMALGLAIRVAYVVATGDQKLAGDEIEYDLQGQFIADGRWFWSTTPYGIAHESIWKAPGYPLWVGALYSLLGPEPDRVLLVQTLLGPVTIGLTWALGRRLFGSAAGLAAALVVAVHPFAWQFEASLFAEALVTPLTVLLLLLVLERTPTVRLAALVGVLAGATMLIRPSSVYALPAVAAAWLIATGFKRGSAMTAVTIGAAALAILPWTARNYDLTGAFVPISLQDAAAYGTFNDQAANDPVFPWAWRPVTPRDKPLFDRDDPLPDAELRARLRENAREYVLDHPSSVPKAFFWNGLSRFWDVRTPARVLDEVPFQGRSRTLTIIGLGIYWILLVGAIVALWRARSRRGLIVPVAVLALSASAVFTTIAVTRYRAPLEPLIAVLACSVPFASRRGAGRAGASSPSPSPPDEEAAGGTPRPPSAGAARPGR